MEDLPKDPKTAELPQINVAPYSIALNRATDAGAYTYSVGRPQMKTITRLLSIALVSMATLTGCGGGGGGTVTPAAAAPPVAPPVNRSLSGQWNGHAVTPGSPDRTDDIFCLIAETLEFACEVDVQINKVFVAGAQGTVQLNGSQVTGTGTLYAAPGTTLPDGSTFAPLTITGTLSGDSLDLTIDAAGVSISVSTTFNDSIYDRGSALATVAGVYSTFDIPHRFGDPASFSVDANGVIFSQSTAGCVSNGQISIIDANFNAYDVTLDVTLCGALNGMYDGLGLTVDANATDDHFIFSVFTSQSVINGHATK